MRSQSVQSLFRLRVQQLRPLSHTSRTCFSLSLLLKCLLQVLLSHSQFSVILSLSLSLVARSSFSSLAIPRSSWVDFCFSLISSSFWAIKTPRSGKSKVLICFGSDGFILCSSVTLSLKHGIGISLLALTKHLYLQPSSFTVRDHKFQSFCLRINYVNNSIGSWDSEGSWSLLPKSSFWWAYFRAQGCTCRQCCNRIRSRKSCLRIKLYPAWVWSYIQSRPRWRGLV